MLLPFLPACRAGFLAVFFATILLARAHWVEYNIGPFTIDTQGNDSEARMDLAAMEQVRWVLGGLLEIQDLRPLWPIRIVLTEGTATESLQFNVQNGQYLAMCAPKTRIPLDEVARLLLDANTPRLPQDAESGLLKLFSSIDVHGSHVSWGGPVPHPDLAYARMQLFATRFEYKASFHIFVTSLKNGSSLRVAEQNAFGLDPAKLEAEAEKNLQANAFQADSTSGRPLDPQRDLGVHAVGEAIVNVYLADSELGTDPGAAEKLYKAAIEAGGAAKPLGYAGLAQLAEREHQDPSPFDEDAIRSGCTAPEVFLQLAQHVPADRATDLLRRASKLNPLWAVPVYRQAELAKDPRQKEDLLKQAANLDPRATQYWIELAHLQASDGHAIEAQGTWMRAEDSAPSAAEKERIDQMRLRAEQARLDAADAERRREQNAAHEEDVRARSDEAARIRAAEAKANQALDAEAAGSAPEKVVPWDDLAAKKNITGSLVRVDCLRGGKRLTIRDHSGHTSLLLLTGVDVGDLSCGAQTPARRVIASYAAEPDESLHTLGRVVSLRFP